MINILRNVKKCSVSFYFFGYYSEPSKLNDLIGLNRITLIDQVTLSLKCRMITLFKSFGTLSLKVFFYISLKF